MFGIKFLVVLFVLTLWQSGGFTAAQFVATLALLLPIFATYTTVMFRNSVRERHVQQYATTVLEPRVSRSFQFTAYGLCSMALPSFSSSACAGGAYWGSLII